MNTEAVSSVQIFSFVRAGIGAVLFFFGLPYLIAGIKGSGKFYEKAVPQNAFDIMGETGVRVSLCIIGLAFMGGGAFLAVKSLLTGLS